MIAFASLFIDKYPKVWRQIDEALQKHNIKYTLIEGCKDIWVRDFMPLSLKNGKFLSYEYSPNYLANSPHLRTPCPKADLELGLVLDGGNFVRLDKKAIICEKIFSENSNLSQEQILSQIQEKAEIQEIIILPRIAYDRYGHSDGMARWIDSQTILLNDFSYENERFISKLSNALKGYKLQTLKYSDEFLKQYKWGAYLNFVEVENLILLPIYGIDEDQKIIEKLQEIYPNKIIEPIECKEIITKGGALHCVSAEVAYS